MLLMNAALYPSDAVRHCLSAGADRITRRRRSAGIQFFPAGPAAQQAGAAPADGPGDSPRTAWPHLHRPARFFLSGMGPRMLLSGAVAHRLFYPFYRLACGHLETRKHCRARNLYAPQPRLSDDVNWS